MVCAAVFELRACTSEQSTWVGGCAVLADIAYVQLLAELTAAHAGPVKQVLVVSRSGSLFW